MCPSRIRNSPARAACNFKIVRDHHNRLPGTVQVLKQLHDLATGLRIEVARRFVGEDHVWFIRHRSGDRNPLTFSARQFHRPMLKPFGQPDRRQQLFCTLAPFAAWNACQGQGDLDVSALRSASAAD